MNDRDAPSDPQARVDSIVRRTSVLSAALGAVLSPIPMADELALVPVYGVMSARIGKARGLGLTQIPWRPIAAAAVTGLGARAALNLAFAFVPGVAAVANAVSGAALTTLIGRYADAACVDPAKAAPLDVNEITAMLKRKLSRVPAAG